MRDKRYCWVLFALLAGVLVGPQARANVAAPIIQPAFGGDPAAVQETPLVVESETLSMDCGGEHAAPVCAFEAVYTLHNPTANPQTLTAAFYGINTQVQTVTLGDKALATRPITEGEAAQIKLPDLHNIFHGRGDAQSLPDRTAFDLSVEPGAKQKLVVRGAIAAGSIFYHSYGLSAARTRHLWLGERDPQNHFVFHYLIEPIQSWGGAPPQIAFSLTAPDDWTVYPSLQAKVPADSPVFSTTQGDDQTQISGQLDGATVTSLTINTSTPHTQFNNGGVLLGFGGRVDDSGGFRARVGYEVSIPDWMMYSVNLDTNFSDDVAVSAVAEAASPSILMIPSFGIGLGPVLQVLPSVQTGLRAQLTVQWPLLGFVTSFDVFPGLDTSDPLMYQATMLGQFGF